MNADESLHLVRMVKAMYPHQAIDEFTPDAWLLLLEDLRFEDCRQALKTLGQQQAFIGPSEVYQEVRRVRAERITKAGPIDPPPEVASGERDYHEWLLETRTRIADGELVPRERPVNHAVRAKVDAAIEGAFQHVPTARAALAEARATLCGHGIPHNVCKEKHE